MSTFGTLTFSIDGEWLTGFARRLWADEGNPKKAMDILTSAFPTMPEEYKLMILTGSKKLVGSSRDGPIDLVDDASTTSALGNPLSMIAVMEASQKEIEELRQSRRDYILAQHAQRERVDELGDFVEDLVERVLPEEEEEERAPRRPPEAVFSITNDFGWLSPDGKFYACGWMEHVALADALGFQEANLEKLGWIRIEAGEAFSPWKEELSQRQMDLIFDWYTQREKDLPSWWRRYVK